MLRLLLVVLLLNFRLVFCADKYSRKDFPSGFVFGAGTSAYQVEGAANEDGRSPSVWDTFAHDGHMQGDTGDVALDGYHKYKDDVKLMLETGLDAYRFSISWSRLIPNGRGPVNPKGLEYYNNLINELVKHGIQPHVTLYHYDLPQALEDEYGGWVSRKIIKDFTAYADVCFREFGNRVSYWTTANEPNILAMGGYDEAILPPGRCSPPFGINCSKGNSSSEPYLVAHHILLAHASTSRLYKRKYQGKQQGFIGLNLFAYCFIPLTNSKEDEVATQRAKDFYHGWFASPLVYGDYPTTMKKIVGSRLPSFSLRESKLIKGSLDFLGVIHYATHYIKDNSESLKLENRDFFADMAVKEFSRFLTKSIRLVTAVTHGITNDDFLVMTAEQDNSFTLKYEFPIRPWGLQGVLEYFKQAYGNPPVYIQENGQVTLRNSSLQDTTRVKYLHAYIGSLLDSVRNGSNTRGYFVWSLLDVFELLDGYKSSYGLYYVDLNDPDLSRHPKLSQHWYSQFLKGKSVSSEAIIELQKNLSRLPQGQQRSYLK